MKKRIPVILPLVCLSSCASVAYSSYDDPNIDDNGTPIIVHHGDSSSSDSNSGDDVNVFILMGQSNMEGNTKAFSSDKKTAYLRDYCSLTPGTDYERYSNGYDNVLISYFNDYSSESGQCNYSNNENPVAGSFVPVKIGQGMMGDYFFGPELGLADALFKEYAETKTTYLIKYAAGNTGFGGSRNWISPSSGTAGSLYNGALEFIQNNLNTLISEGKNPLIRGFLWNQGEYDCGASNYNIYSTHLNNLYSDLLAHFEQYCPRNNTEEAAFLDATIAENEILLVNYESINNQKKLVSQKRYLNFLIDTSSSGIDLATGEPGGDSYHYNVGSMLKLGKAYGNIIIDNNLTE